jgi:hypothetical protein
MTIEECLRHAKKAQFSVDHLKVYYIYDTGRWNVPSVYFGDAIALWSITKVYPNGFSFYYAVKNELNKWQRGETFKCEKIERAYELAKTFMNDFNYF